MDKLAYLRSLFMMTALGFCSPLCAQPSNPNQTDTITPISPTQDNIPFHLRIQTADFSLPNGNHSGVFATHDGKWVFLAGRTNGLHGFNDDTNNFPPEQQNQAVYVVDPHKKKVYSRLLTDPGSGLTAQQIDQLSVTSPQSYQDGDIVYITGGYGVDSSTGLFSTKDVLTAIDVPALIHWVTHPCSKKLLSHNVRQLSDPNFQVTGGFMSKVDHGHPTLLVFGQNFLGYYVPESEGIYTMQVRRFKIHDDGKILKVTLLPPLPATPDPNYRRRDLNVCPTIKVKHGKIVKGLTAFSGVFTLDSGVWTVPVEITAAGIPTMADPNAPRTFKQGMNNYVSAGVEFFSQRYRDFYVTLFGGISYGYFQNGVFMTDTQFPFINDVTTIKRDKHGIYSQSLMTAEFPVILSTQSNPGNPLLFGTGAYFITASDIPKYGNEVIKLDKIHGKHTVIGYIVGGIMSTLPNTTSESDSAASPYIFEVILDR